MNTNNLQQWWESTYRHHQLKNVFNPNDLKSGDSTKLDLLQQIGSNDYGAVINYTLKDYSHTESEENTISSMTFIVMVILFGIVVFGGVLGNATLILTLCSASSIRLRNPLLMAACFADLMVTGISAPITILNVSLNQKTITLSIIICKIIHFVQIMPVAASTISFFMLSLDRYATVRHPCLARLRQRRYLHVSLALLSWILSATISLPFLFSYRILAKSAKSENEDNKQYLISSETSSGITEYTKFKASSHSNTVSTNFRITCISELDASTIFIPFIIFHTFAVFIIPGFGVLLNHYGVRQKLCALSLTARAAHGELPLPMPILRRQTHMVIVTGIANAQQAGGCTTDDTSNEPDIQMQSLNPSSVVGRGHNYVKSSNPISPRAMREIRAHSQRQRINQNQGALGPAAPGIPLPRTSTLHSRRRLANVLIASALIFIICWFPHVFCILYTNSGYQHYCSNTSKYFHLLLGYSYSAISPIIYWILNHNSLKQSPCAPIIRLRSMQNFLRTRLRSNTVPPPPSSTNEAALGAFNPKLIRLTPKQYRAQASSHYLY
ncbi:alpha-2A adrenergic receptor [Ceratitis capitata]|uniref:(Mediterranean fruit fly) hypothetical protein n=1 Tax=Ceratitis capitata TaxID=7213 RepID=W8C0X1_CERCA|nr:alpha-2A adrenergic receptor [Ceratitis capitata]XP_020713562.1 alpha-2A adrenergic receptor [Ceratitis capitata]CAD6997634.1 unnamed protein product [Ceratitis capitata]